MSGIVVDRSISSIGDALVVLDPERRLYAGLSRDRARWHVIAPLETWHPLVGDGKRRAGQLGCSCQAGTFRGECYRTKEAEALEAGQAGPSWLSPSPAEVRHERLLEEPSRG